MAGQGFGAPVTLSFFEELDFDDEQPTEPQRRSGRDRVRSRLARTGGGGGRGGDGGGDEPGEGGSTRPGGPRRGAGGTNVQFQRLLPVVGILLVVILGSILWIRSCQRVVQRRAYRNYVASVNSVVTQSDQVGQQLDEALRLPDQTSDGLVRSVGALARRQQEIENTTADLKDTGKLKGLQLWLTTVMQYRTRGLQSLGQALDAALGPDRVTTEGAQAAATAFQRLTTSDVLYQDSFQAPALRGLNEASIRDAKLADSNFAKIDSYTQPGYMRQALVAVKAQDKAASGGGDAAACPTGAYGTAIDSVIALPSAKTLEPGVTNTIAGRANLRYQVTVSNPGETRITNRPVRLTEQGKQPIERMVDVLNPGEKKTVTFIASQPLSIGTPETLTVRIEPVPTCEKAIENNSAEYTVNYTA